MGIDADVLEVNPHCEVTVHHVGPSKRKVLLADQFYRHPEKVGELALSLYYTASHSLVGSYPGSRAVVTLETDPLIQTLGKLWGESLRPYHSDYHPVIFSAIENRSYRLSPWQRQPHIDQGVTAMVYLNPEHLCAGGTGLYRHKPTGLDRIPLAITPQLQRIAEQHGFSAKSLEDSDGYAEFMNTAIFNPAYAAEENTYINDGNQYWELLFLIQMKSNRLVIFDGRMPHSQHITKDQFQDCFRINQILYFQGHD